MSLKLQKAVEKAKTERQRRLGEQQPDLVHATSPIDPHDDSTASARSQKVPVESASEAPLTTASPEDALKADGVRKPSKTKTTDNIAASKASAPLGKTAYKKPVYTESRRIVLDMATALRNRCVALAETSEETEFYKILRTQIQQRTQPSGWKTVMITSPRSGEGKTLTSINLAITMAKEYHQTVLLVDCDLKRQNIHRYLGIESGKGLINYLLKDQPLNELIIWPNIENMTLISGGGLIQESTELLGSSKMKALVQEMKNRYEDRYVLFDLPPLLSGADALAFAPIVDCILLVVQSGRTSKGDIKKALDLIPKEKLLGFALNRFKSPMKPYYKYLKSLSSEGNSRSVGSSNVCSDSVSTS